MFVNFCSTYFNSTLFALYVAFGFCLQIIQKMWSPLIFITLTYFVCNFRVFYCKTFVYYVVFLYSRLFFFSTSLSVCITVACLSLFYGQFVLVQIVSVIFYNMYSLIILLRTTMKLFSTINSRTETNKSKFSICQLKFSTF